MHTWKNGTKAVVYAPCTVSDLTDKGYDYRLGHVRKKEILSEGHMLFFGNIQGRHIRKRNSPQSA
ncbi:MAG: hypothetical protein R2941_02715 [Desulfobacterales bacterium]